MRVSLRDGFSLVELMITVSIMGGLAMVVSSVHQYVDRQSHKATESIEGTILKLGASKVLINDLTNAAPSFNFIDLADDRGMPFFVHDKRELCMPVTGDPKRCERTIALQIPARATRSQDFYLLTIKGKIEEKLKLMISPRNTFNGTNFESLNRYYGDPDKSFTKSHRPESPWIADRLIMLSSENQFPDCSLFSHSMTPLTPCVVDCPTTGTCNHALSRPLRLVGVVNANNRDMTYRPLALRPEVFKTAFQLFRSGAVTDLTVDTTRKLVESLPYLPGLDNSVSISPVEVVRYHLEKPSSRSRPANTSLIRSVATLYGSRLSFRKTQVLATGIQSVVFTRKNISYPAIEFKIHSPLPVGL